MAKVLKITKPDKTIHVAPLINKSQLESYNKRQKADKKWKIEVIDESEAKDLPYKDENYVTGADAVKMLSQKDAEIEKLKKQLAVQNGGAAGNTETPPADANSGAPVPSASEKIALIKAAETVDQVNEIAKEDTRTSVINAAAKKIADLQPKP